MDPASKFGILLGIVVLFITTAAISTWSQITLYRLLKQKKPGLYEQLGRPQYWSFNNRAYVLLLWGQLKFPDDYRLASLTLTFRIATFMSLVTGIAFFILMYF